MLNAEFYAFTQQVQGALYGALFAGQAKLGEPLSTLPSLLQIRGGYAESPGWFLVQASEFDPEPLTVENLRVRDIYASARIVAALLEIMASEQWLKRQEGAYHLTQAGRDLLRQLRQRTLKLAAVIDGPMPMVQLERLASLLAKVIEASMQTETPPGVWCLAHSRNRAPADEAPLILRITHYFSDFNAFRDDAHMAAWQAYHVSGHAWEAFALICAGRANSAADVYSELPFRGYAEDEYAAELGVLAKRGWLIQNARTFVVTDNGRAIWAEAEQLTDDYFYAPWSTLNQGEQHELQQLLEQLHERAQKIAGSKSRDLTRALNVAPSAEP